MKSKVNKKILLSMGTRPEIIKMAPLYYALKQMSLNPFILHTGQHRELAEPLYEFFNMKPDFSLNLVRKNHKISSRGSSRSMDPYGTDLPEIASTMLQEIAPVLRELKPAIIAVHGDTLSALMAAQAAFYFQITIAHIEAGLRSHNKYEPFPEEINRAMIGPIADLHFAPTPQARKNLLNENVPASKIYTVGNTVVDAAKIGIKKINPKKIRVEALVPSSFKDLHFNKEQHKLILVTAHRRENQPEIKNIMRAVGNLLQQHKDMYVLWPVHPNPRILAGIEKVFNLMPPDIANRICLTKPLNYPELLWSIQQSWLVMTDSGGIQEEAVALRTPVLVLRDTTERPEVVEYGGGELVGTDRKKICRTVNLLLKHPERYKKMRLTKNPFGNGTAGRKISKILAKELNVSTKKHLVSQCIT